MNDTYVKIALGIVYVAAGLLATLAGFNILHPFKNNPEKVAAIVKYQTLYRFGGLVVLAYGISRLVQLI